MRDLYMKNGRGFIMVYSLVERSTFADIEDLYEQILRVQDADWVPAILVANKADLVSRRQISAEEGERLAKKLKVPYLETSALSNSNIEDIFFTLVRDMGKFYSPTTPRDQKKKTCQLL